MEPRADRPQAVTLAADKAYDAEDFINELRAMKVTPHVAQNTSGRSSTAARRDTPRRVFMAQAEGQWPLRWPEADCSADASGRDRGH